MITEWSASEIGGHLEHDGPQLVMVVHPLQVEHAGRAHREYRGGGAYPVTQLGVGSDEYVHEAVQPVTEAREPFLAVVQALDRGPVLLEETEALRAGQHDPDVAVKKLTARLVALRLLLGPVQEGVKLREVIVGEAVDDVFLGLEVVIESGLGHAEPLGDLPQRGLLVPVLGEEFERHLLHARPGVGPRRGPRRPRGLRRPRGPRGPCGPRRPRAWHVRHVSLVGAGAAVFYLTAG